MTTWKTIILCVAVVATAAGFGYVKSSHRHIPADLRDAVADKGKFDTSLPVFDKNSGKIPEPKVAAVEDTASKTAVVEDIVYPVLAARLAYAKKTGQKTAAECPQCVHKAWGLYIDAKARLDGWIAGATFELHRDGVIANPRYRKAFYEFMHKGNLYFNYVGGPIPDDCIVSGINVEKWLKDIQQQYDGADDQKRAAIRQDINNLKWPFADEVLTDKISGN